MQATETYTDLPVQTMTAYRTIVGNDPVNWVDPFGLYSWNGFLYDTSDFSAGFGDTITFGGTEWIRSQWNEAFGWDDVVDKCSGAYTGGKWAGYAWEAAFGGAVAARTIGTTTLIKTRATPGADLATSQILKVKSKITDRTIEVIHRVIRNGKTIHKDVKFQRFWPF